MFKDNALNDAPSHKTRRSRFIFLSDYDMINCMSTYLKRWFKHEKSNSDLNHYFRTFNELPHHERSHFEKSYFC